MRLPLIFAATVASLPSATAEETVYDYDAHIAPLLEQYCVDCHGPEKQKSKFRLDSFAHLLTPGSSDEVPIIPFAPLESPLLEYLLMPKSDEYAMPPQDEPTPTAGDIVMLSQWIYHGAKSSVAERLKLPLEERLDPAALDALLRQRERGVIIQPLSQKNPGLIMDLRGISPEITSNDFVDLSVLAPLVIELNLAHQNLAAAPPDWFGQFTHLSRLNLSGATVPAPLIAALNSLPALQELNLFKTTISPAALKELKLPAIEKINIGQLNQKPPVIRQLRAQHPQATFIDDVNYSSAEIIDQNARHNSNAFNPGDPVIIGEQISPTGIRHSILICGPITAIISEDNEVLWRGPDKSRDGVVLLNGNPLISVQGEAREYRAGTLEIVWSYRLDARNRELGTVYRLDNGNTLVVERGELPRLLEISPTGEIVVNVPLQPETDNAHMQTRMARKLPNGNYLVPHLLAFKIKEYTPAGKVVDTIVTDLPELGGREKRNWPFTAIRLANGNTLASLTNGNKVVEFAPDGSIAWRLDNSDVADRLADPCGAQRLPNGNTIISSYGQKDDTLTRIFEVTPDKKVVWDLKFPAGRAHGVHVFTTNGSPVLPLMK
jgi:hypothetical protein